MLIFWMLKMRSVLAICTRTENTVATFTLSMKKQKCNTISVTANSFPQLEKVAEKLILNEGKAYVVETLHTEMQKERWKALKQDEEITAPRKM